MASPLAANPPAQIEVEVLAALRSLTPARRLMLARDMNWMADWLALAGIVRRQPAAGQPSLGLELARQRLGPEQLGHAESLLGGLDLPAAPGDPLELALRLGAALDRLGVPYAIVGSLAAVAHGEHRLTRDLDLLIDLGLDRLGALVDGLWAEAVFLAGDIAEALARLPAAREDVCQRACFWAYDRASGFPIDLCLSAGRPFETDQLQRAQTIRVPLRPGGALRVASAEDTVLAKLQWYAQAPSYIQWRDLQAILLVQERRLDRAYLRRWAADLGVAELLRLAMGGGPPPQRGPEGGE